MIRHSIAFAVKLNKCLLYVWNPVFSETRSESKVVVVVVGVVAESCRVY